MVEIETAEMDDVHESRPFQAPRLAAPARVPGGRASTGAVEASAPLKELRQTSGGGRPEPLCWLDSGVEQTLEVVGLSGLRR
jgi:hypothetical protein